MCSTSDRDGDRERAGYIPIIPKIKHNVGGPASGWRHVLSVGGVNIVLGGIS